MHRQRYIRFFISSTFADMTLERNLLQEVMDELSEEYVRKGWQIEAVDLRWGITREAGLDNRTIQICIEELGRCREMSPQPNFIVLLGERYGWVPLPEVLSLEEAETVMGMSLDSEREIFDRWYKCDYNQLPEPVYVLQPRTGRYVDDSVWESEVCGPLMQLLLLIDGKKYSMSATEMEIQEGALNVENAHEHVIGYFRSLSDVPSDERPVFTDGNTESLNALKDKLKAKLSSGNTYSENLSYTEYQSDSFRLRFMKNMKFHLISVINHAISDYEEVDDENTIHMELAEKETRFFVGREKELAEIDEYINNPEANYALWYRSRSGSGKSALISQVAQRYKDSHNVILRFCGETEQSHNGYLLLKSVWEKMRELYPLKGWAVRDLPDSDAKVGFSYMSASDLFNTRLSALKDAPKPLLILIDGMNQLIEDGSDEFFQMKWVDCKLSPNVRVIMTSTESHALDVKPKEIRIKELGALESNDDMALIGRVLDMNGRKLSESSLGALDFMLAFADATPIYLSIFANSLLKLRSYDELPGVPIDFEHLVKSLLKRVSAGHNHDSLLVKLSLSLMVADRKGLSQPELLRILAMDGELMSHLKESSFHEFRPSDKSPVIPPVLWSRLYADISFFFRMRHDKLGNLLYVYHSELSAAISGMYMQDDDYRLRIYSLLADFYKDFSTPHAVSEAVASRYMAFECAWKIHGSGIGHDREIYTLLTNPRYIFKKYNQDKDGLLADFDLMLSVARITGRSDVKHIISLKNDITDIQPSRWEQFVCQCLNLHVESPLRALVENGAVPEIPVLKDALCSVYPYEMTAYTSTRHGEDILISDDGSRVLSLFKNRHEVKVEDMDDNRYSAKYTHEDSIKAIDASSDLRIHAILIDEGVIIYDYIEKKRITTNGNIQKATWVSISADGKHYAYGGETCCCTDKIKINNFVSKSGKLSSSGQVLWVASDIGVLWIDVDTYEQGVIDCGGKYDSNASKVNVIAASDDMCILRMDTYVFNIYKFKYEDGTPMYTDQYRRYEEQEEFFGAVEEERMIAIGGGGDCFVVKCIGTKIHQELSTNMMNISAVSRNMRFAYSRVEQKSFNLSCLLETYRAFSAFNVGINTLASDYSGNCLAVTKGINKVQEISREMFVAENGNRVRKLDLSSCRSGFFMSCSVSPKGDSMWISEYGQQEKLLRISSDGHVVEERPDAGSAISINFTDDGKFMATFRGEHICDRDPLIHIYDGNGNLLRKFMPVESWKILSFQGHLTLSNCNRYAISEDGDLIDLIDEKLVFSALSEGVVRDDAVRDRIRMTSAQLFAVYPFGGIIRGSLSVIDCSGRIIRNSYDKKVIGCTHSGRYVFCLDNARNLYLLSLFTREEHFLAEGVAEVFPLHNERFVFIRQSDGTILFCDIHERKMLQRAYFDNCDFFRVNARGLAAVSGNGKLCLFEPDAEYGIRSDMAVTLAYRWDLGTKARASVPTAVCPVCAHVFTPSDGVIGHISTHPVSCPEDWEHEILRGECPSCHATLKFNPAYAGSMKCPSEEYSGVSLFDIHSSPCNLEPTGAIYEEDPVCTAELLKMLRNQSSSELFHALAERGNLEAQMKLGYCYEHGKGVRQDLKEALRWYLKAAVQNDKTAIDKVQELQKNSIR